MLQPLTHLKDGETGIVISFSTPPSHRFRHHAPPNVHHNWGFQKRLEDMGLTPGAKVKVIKSAPFRGPIELQVRGSRLAIGRGMASRIIVRLER